MVGERYRVRGWIGGAAALALSLSALAACGRQAPEETDIAASMPDAGAGQGTTAGGSAGDGTMSAPNGTPVASGTGAAGTTTPSATGTAASGAVNPTDPSATTPASGPETR